MIDEIDTKGMKTEELTPEQELALVFAGMSRAGLSARYFHLRDGSFRIDVHGPDGRRLPDAPE